ncbi:hypothetical protein ABEG17_03070 [Pedococcus sp. KACC 23699]|uniref:Polysaccharide biosynthesis protein n=1 Tax=Pedococcus sp. KACC 23699 TaxID=3149228 RepID=A0AAU7JV83_9MICO
MVVGLSGWATLVVVARTTGPASYAYFSVIWGLYFSTIGLMSGLQHEAGNVVPVAEAPSRRKMPLVVSALAGVGAAVAVLAMATAGLWTPPIFDRSDLGVAVILAVGVVIYCVYAAILGGLAQAGEWRSYAWLAATDASTRLALVAGGSLLGWGAHGLAGALVLAPASWLLYLAAPAVRASARSRLLVSLSGFLHRMWLTMATTGANALLTVGFPVMVSASSARPLDAHDGVALAAIALTRAPLLVPLGIFQTLIIGSLSRQPGLLRSVLVKGTFILLAVTIAFGALTLAVGPPLFEAVLGDTFRLPAWTLTFLVVSSLPTAVLVVTGSCLIALKRQASSAAGWLLAVIVTFCALRIDVDLASRAPVAITLGAAAGIAAHVLALSKARTNIKSQLETASRFVE